jgi:hypothetical protein
MTSPSHKPAPTRRRDPADPAWKSVELAQRGRMILDVAAADLAMAEERLGAFHPTTWHFRNALAEARRSWDRLRVEYGGAALEAALAEPPVAILTLGDDAPGGPLAILIPIGGKTYRVERIAGTEPAPRIWRLTRLPPRDDGPYYACRLRDGSTQCDCAEWAYAADDAPGPLVCKHLAALAALGWI